MLPDFAREQLEAGLDAAAAEVLARAGVERPPVDAFAVAECLGVALAWDERQEGRGRYVRLSSRGARPPRATILLRPDPRREREQWALAHEIGEHVAPRVFRLLGVDPAETGPAAREVLANQLARRLLLPTAWFEAAGRACGWDLVRLKARFATASHELVARRMLDLRPSTIVSIFDHGRLSFRRSNLPGRVPPPTAAEMACWRAVHRRNRPRRLSDGLRIVRGWPIHEDGWKREILRTDVEDFIDG